jgi:uncharacterized membrane protein
MPVDLQELVRKLFHNRFDELTDRERRVLDRYMQRKSVSMNTNSEFSASLSLGQRISDRVAAFGGSWPFIGLFGLFLAVWVVTNAVILARRGTAFDPYPFILLNLFLSMLAAVQAPVILMSQNRQASKDRLDAAHDYEVNLKAELEILTLHEKIDSLREQQWNELMTLQRQQIGLLEKLLAGHGTPEG